MEELKLTPPQIDIASSRRQISLFLAGQGSGKTHVAGVVSYMLISQFPKVRGLIAANTYSQLNKSTMFRIREVWKQYFDIHEYNPKTGIGSYVISKTPPKHFVTFFDFDSYANIVSFSWGAVIYIGSLDNYKALDGMEIGYALLDETKDTRETAVKEVIIGRLRQKGIFIKENNELTTTPTNRPFNPLYIFTSPAKVPWINEWFRLDDFQDQIKKTIYYPPDYFLNEFENKLVTISATQLNAENLPITYIDNQMANLPNELQNMLIYGDPFSKAGGEFYKGFDRGNNTAKGLFKKHYKEDRPLHLSFDFNVNPYITLTIWVVNGKKAFQVDEMCLKSPKNSTPAICKSFLSKYRNHKGGLFIYGDPAGRHQDTRSEAGANDFTIIFRELKLMKPRDRVATKAPPVAMRGQWQNLIFESGYNGIELLIDESNRNTVADYLYLKEAPDGTKAKITELDENKVRFEKYGHTSDANDYFLCQVFNADWNKYHKGGAGVVVPNKKTSKNIY